MLDRIVFLMHACMYLGYTTGTLQTAIDNSELRRLPQSQTMFYAAEITLALLHLHDLGELLTTFLNDN